MQPEKFHWILYQPQPLSLLSPNNQHHHGFLRPPPSLFSRRNTLRSTGSPAIWIQFCLSTRRSNHGSHPKHRPAVWRLSHFISASLLPLLDSPGKCKFPSPGFGISFASRNSKGFSRQLQQYSPPNSCRLNPRSCIPCWRMHIKSHASCLP